MPQFRLISKDILHLFSRAGTRKEYLEKTVELLAERLGVPCVGIRLVGKNGQIAYEAYRGFSDAFWREENELSLQGDHCLCSKVIRGTLDPQDQPFATPFASVFCNDLRQYEESLNEEQKKTSYRGACSKHGYRSLAVIPIRRKDDIFGAIHLADHEKDKIPSEMVAILEEMVPIFAEAVFRFTLEEQLRKSEASLKSAQRIASVGHWEWNLGDDEVYWSDQTFYLHGFEPGVFKPSYETFLSFVHPSIRNSIDDVVQDALEKSKPFEIEYRMLRKDGVLRDIHAQGEVALDEEGRKTGLLGVLRDISDEKKAREQIHFQASLLEQVRNGVVAVDLKDRLTYWNEYAETLFQWQSEEVVGDDLISLVLPDDEKVKVKAIKAGVERNGYWEGEINTRRKDGTVFAAEVTLAEVKNVRMEKIGYVGVINDIESRKRLEKQLQFISAHDPLTGLHNRHTLEDSLTRAVAGARRGHHQGLLIIGIDNFHLINEELGFSAGDKYLIQFADFLKHQLREADMIVRLAGNEFAALLSDSDEQISVYLAERLRRNLSSEEFALGLSLTIGVMPIDGDIEAEKILPRASLGLESAKEAGGNRVIVIDSRQDPVGALSEMNQMVSLINRALEEGLFKLYYQPVVDLASGEISHHEGLIRLVDPGSNQFMSPGQFIPLAEKYGLMPAIDNRVVELALEALKDYTDLKLFINLSGATLDEERLLKEFLEAIQKSRIEPGRLGIEITETVAVKNLITAETWIKKLKSAGCSFALDDFGIGFSSFSYLKLLPVDYIKIDGFFVKKIDVDSDQRVMVEAISRVAKSMGKQVIAEFVENGAVVKTLKQLEVDFGQGYYLGKPGPKPLSFLNKTLY